MRALRRASQPATRRRLSKSPERTKIMSPKYKVAVLVGSLRKESFTRKIAGAIAPLAPPQLSPDVVEIGNLPHYDQDADDQHRPPPEWIAFRQRIAAFDAVLFVTPEYNRSVPGVLKNAIDVGSRPYGQSVWDAKPAAIVSVTPGAMGGFGANHHLRQSLTFLNMPVLQQPEAYLAHADTLVTEDGEITNDATAQFLSQFIEAFAHWISVTAAPRQSATHL
jgi:chromate reductase